MRNPKPILLLGASLVLLTAYVYLHASLETFAIYLLALSLWAGLFGYCVHSRQKRAGKSGPSIRQP